MIFLFLWLTYFTQCDNLQVHLCCFSPQFKNKTKQNVSLTLTLRQKWQWQEVSEGLFSEDFPFFQKGNLWTPAQRLHRCWHSRSFAVPHANLPWIPFFLSGSSLLPSAKPSVLWSRASLPSVSLGNRSCLHKGERGQSWVLAGWV